MASEPSADRPVLFEIDPVTKAAIGRIVRGRHCPCLQTKTKKGPPSVPNLHVESQDEGAPGWAKLVALVDEAAQTSAIVLEPSAHMDGTEGLEVITLPATIAGLDRVRELRLYGSHLRRLPPEIGRMGGLESLDLYTSYSLHWLPYEVTRCGRLRDSRISTRALYGNQKTMLPFPRLHGPVESLRPETCSICDRGFGERSPHLWWITLRIGTDIVPLLVHSCSNECTSSLPRPPDGYHPGPHKGGGGVGMPERDRWG